MQAGNEVLAGNPTRHGLGERLGAGVPAGHEGKSAARPADSRGRTAANGSIEGRAVSGRMVDGLTATLAGVFLQLLPRTDGVFDRRNQSTVILTLNSAHSQSISECQILVEPCVLKRCLAVAKNI